MAYEGNSGIQVANHYGARNTGASVGIETSKDAFHSLNFELTGNGLADKFLPPFVVPKGASIQRALLVVDTAFAGVTSLSIGEGKAEATNGITLLAADLAVGTRDVTDKLKGTWAAKAATTKGASTGLVVAGTPDPKVGRATVVIEYIYKTHDDAAWKPDSTTFKTYKPQR